MTWRRSRVGVDSDEVGSDRWCGSDQKFVVFRGGSQGWCGEGEGGGGGDGGVRGGEDRVDEEEEGDCLFPDRFFFAPAPWFLF